MLSSLRAWSLPRRLLLLVGLAPVLGLLGVVAAEAVPDGRIGYHLLRAEAAGTLESTERSPSSLGTTTDHFSECVALTVGLGDRAGDNIVAAALRSSTYIGCADTIAAIDQLAATDTLVEGSSYLRYWHGYAVLTRPAIGVLGLEGARWLSFGLLAAVLAVLAAAIHRRFGTTTAALLLGPALLTTDMVAGGFTLSQALGLASAWGGGLLVLLTVERDPRWTTAAVVAALAGCLVAYMDLLTSLPGSLALTVIGACLGARAAAASSDAVAWRVPLAALGGWVVGLVWTWAGKWLLAAAVLGADDVVDNVRDQVRFRLSGEHEGVSASRLRGLTSVLEMWWGEPLTPWLLAAVLVTLAVLVARWRGIVGVGRSTAVACAVVIVAVEAWFELLSNHSQIHAWLVYRSLPIAAGAMAALASVDLRGARPTPTEAEGSDGYTAPLPSRAHSSVG